MFKIFLISLLFTLNVFGQVSGQEKKNYLVNGDFEIGKTGWTKTGSMNLNILTGTNALDGKQSLEVSDSAFQTSTVYQNFLVNDNLANKTCSLSFIAKNTSATTTGSVTVKIRTGATVGAMSDLANASVVVPVGTSKETYTISGFICPQKGYYVGVMVTVVGGTDNFNPTVAVLDNFRVDLTNFNEVPNVTSMKNYGGATIAATGGGFTLGTVTRNIVWGRQVGDRGHVRYELARSVNTGYVNGTGRTLFSLPAGMEFDDSKVVYNTNLTNAAPQTIISTVGYLYQGTVWSELSVVPYDSNRFMVFVSAHSAAANGGEYLGNNYTLGGASVGFSLDFQFPLKGASNSATVINAECPSIEACTDTFVAEATSAGVVSKLNTDSWVGNGSVSGTTVFTHTFKSNLFSVAPTCIVSPVQGTDDGFGKTAWIQSVSNTTLVIKTRGGDSTLTAYPYTFSCTRNTTDFKGKRIIQGEIGVSTLGDFKWSIVNTSILQRSYINASNSSIGGPSSGATYQGSKYYDLYAVIWNFVVSGSSSGAFHLSGQTKGASAAADYAAGKLLVINFSSTGGLFVRATDTSASNLGVFQGDAIRNISGSFNLSAGLRFIASGAFAGNGATGPNSGSFNGSGTSSGVNFNASNVVPTASENRPVNVALVPYLGFVP